MANKERTRNNRKVFITSVLMTGILIAVYVVCQFAYTSIDATEERRYTLAPATKKLLKDLDTRIYVKVLLTGKFPAGFKRLQESTEDILRRFSQISPEIEYNFENPNMGTAEEVNERRTQLAQQGLVPTQLRVTDVSGASSQYIYPFAVIHYGTRRHSVSLLQDDIPGADKDIIINNSINLLEYKIADGIQKVKSSRHTEIAFTTGNGELTSLQTASIEKELRSSYTVHRIDLDSVIRIPQQLKALIIAKPTEPFNEAQLFLLDQYIMHGGNVMFFLDPLQVSIDSISMSRNYIPPPTELGLDPLLFMYGARVNPNLILDLQSTRIPMVVGMQGDKVQTELFPWYYFPLISATSDHPITKGLDRIQLEFPASVDTIQTKAAIQKTILLRSSQYSRMQLTPVRLSFDILSEEPDPKLFNKGPQSFAVMLEGAFESMFQNRLNVAQQGMLQRAGLKYKPTGEQAKVLVVADGDMIRNPVNHATGETAPLGYNKYENTTFTGNRDFMLNSIEYMLDETGVLEARSKDIKLRLMNSVKAREEAIRWQLINILGPMMLVLLFGIVYYFFRKRKFGYAT